MNGELILGDDLNISLSDDSLCGGIGKVGGHLQQEERDSRITWSE